MKNLLLGSFLAAVALFIWGFIYFGISGIPYNVLGHSSDAVALSLKASFPSEGTYIFPDPGTDEMAELQKRGPVAMVHIKPNGVANPMSMMGTGFLHGWIYCILLALLLKQICKKTEYGGRVGFVVLVATTGAFVARFGDAIWWQQSWGWLIGQLRLCRDRWSHRRRYSRQVYASGNVNPNPASVSRKGFC